MRLRIFAGPNGSGKSTLKSVLKPEWLGIYINPDEIEAKIKNTNIFNFQTFNLKIQKEEIKNFLFSHPLIEKGNLKSSLDKIIFLDNRIDFSDIKINSYFASILSDFVRRKLIKNGEALSFETVMSSTDKIEFLRYAKEKGYKTYLYFIATDDPQINIQRVDNRVVLGGHNVPKEKIISRYYKSLDNLYEAVKTANRSFVFDNSGDERIFLAEINEGNVELKVDRVPLWFEKYFIKKAMRT